MPSMAVVSSASVEGGMAGAFGEERLDAVREVVCLEQWCAGACGQRVGHSEALLAVGKQELLCDPIRACRAAGQPARERERLVIELGVRKYAVDDAPVGERRRGVGACGEYGLDCAAGAGARGEPIGAADDWR